VRPVSAVFTAFREDLALPSGVLGTGRELGVGPVGGELGGGDGGSGI
jgi:hypothetical protein